jgi:hypothetical protein
MRRSYVVSTPGAAEAASVASMTSTPTQTDGLAGKTVAFIATNGFEDSELTALAGGDGEPRPS